MKCFRIFAGLAAVTALASASVFAQDPGWPRKLSQSGGTMIIYQPQVDSWTNYTNISWRQAFQLTPNGGKQIVGAASMTGTTNVDNDKHMVTIYGIQVTNTYFPGQDPATTGKLDTLVRTFVPPVVNIALERLAAYLPKTENVKTVPVNNDPPTIFVNYSPAILLGVDGNPIYSPIANTALQYIVNTNWPVFQLTKNHYYYLLVDNIWLSSGSLSGPWVQVPMIPKDFNNLPNSGRFVDVRKMVPPPQVANPVIPMVFYSTVPSEIILFDGQPTYTPISGTQLSFANNTDSPVFLYAPTHTFYYLAAGRWFSAPSLSGPWTFATFSLPADFANIPLSNPASAILASVPGTPEAKDAVLISQIPTTMTLDPAKAAAQASVSYTGAPEFAPIQGTSLQYATNTPDKVIQVGDVYYLCLQGVWFLSSTPQGPWTTAPSVPQVIYTIPPSSPVYNVTYVTQTTVGPNVEASYTAGYLGAFAMGAVVGAVMCSGTGFYYPPYVGYPPGGYPVYHPYATPYGAYGAYGTPYYNAHNGSYGVSSTTYGPYGSSTTHAASYNPYTGTYKQGTSVSTPYGRQSAGQAYNPYTGTYGATHQGSSPTAQWGQSYVQNGNKSATTQHYSTANGSVGSVQGSQGGHGYATSSAYGNTYAGKNSSGDMYAGHDGNVYQSTGSGWQKYNSSTNSWNNVNTQQAQQQAQQDKQSYEQQHPDAQQNYNQDKQNYQQQHPDSQQNMQQHQQSYNQEHPSGSSGGWNSQSMDQDRQNRMSGASQSSHYQGGQHSFGGYGGGGRSWGGGGGGFRR